MLHTLDLVPVVLQGAAVEGEGPLATFRGTGQSPRLTLNAADGVPYELAPGSYLFEVELRANGPVHPFLIHIAADGLERSVRLDAQGSYGWRVDLQLTQATGSLVLGLDGPREAFLLARCRISTRMPNTGPNFRDAVMQVARALYHKAPRFVRRSVSRLLVRQPQLAQLRVKAISTNEVDYGGEIRVRSNDRSDGAELSARRADFDARFAVARGLGEPIAEIAAEPATSEARVVAFYLPQYHRIPENDAWWGEGFTEWTNVSKAVSQFIGHHQPRLPGELGFYDLTAPEAMRRQVELARSHGVSAFCFHYYWFAGKRLLERPLDAFRADASLDIGFTLCWANENWTRRWDGAEDAVLVAQQHSHEDYARVFDNMASYLEDPRALRVGGKPMLVVYRPALMPDALMMTEIWRKLAAARGWPGVYLAATDAFQFEDVQKLGFDGLVEFPPHGLVPPRIEKRLSWLNPNHRGVVYDYTAAAEEAIARLSWRRNAGFDVFPGVMPGWDNEARRPGAGNIFHGATPQAYARWLSAACEISAHTCPTDSRLVFVNAWNEWAEGAYLEPDRRWGRAFLDATARVVGASQLSTRVER